MAVPHPTRYLVHGCGEGIHELRHVLNNQMYSGVHDTLRDDMKVLDCFNNADVCFCSLIAWVITRRGDEWQDFVRHMAGTEISPMLRYRIRGGNFAITWWDQENRLCVGEPTRYDLYREWIP